MIKTYLALLAVIIVIGVAGAWYFLKAPGASVILGAPTQINKDAYPLYTGVEWGSETAGTRIIGGVTLSGYEVRSAMQKDLTDLSAVSLPFVMYYKNKLLAHGWKEDLDLAADGPGSGLTVFRKGAEYLVLGFSSDFKVPGKNAPDQCPCDLTMSVFNASAK